MHSLGRVRYIFTVALLSLAMVAVMGAPAGAFTISVVDQNGVAISVPASPNPDYAFSYRWLLEEDTTHDIQPRITDPNTLAVSIHRSYNPVVAAGDSRNLGAIDTALALAPEKRYYLSVLPRSGYTMSGVNLLGTATSATVHVNTLPIQAAQITVYAFHDNQPVNAAPDVPVEEPLAGFQVLLFDQLGHEMTDVFGNNLGTEYQTDGGGNYVFDAGGNPIVLSQGNGIFTGADGQAVIKNIAPGKYGVRVVPNDLTWIQTTTIEGTPGIDTWVRSGEPPFFNELGFLTWHAFVGFVKTMEFGDPGSIPTGTGSVTGVVKQMRQNRPPAPIVAGPGKPVAEAYVALNNLSGADEQVYTAPCDVETGAFTISNVPAGTYQLVVWDLPLDVIIDFRTVIVGDGEAVDLGDVPVFMWFANFEGSVFYDENQNGFRDPGELGIPNVPINIRFRDGSMYASTQTTPPNGEFGFSEVFPFFKWLVTEVDFAAPLKATGATFYVDNGGLITDTALGINPQDQNTTDPPYTQLGSSYRTEVSTLTAPVLVEGMMDFAGQTNIADWGKTAYDTAAGENGGISGIVYYAATRAEDDPRLAAAEGSEPGVPGVTVNLYAATHNPGGLPTVGALIASVETDSFDANMPAGCEYDTPPPFPTDCAETFRTWNQMRPTVFDGGYGFFEDPNNPGNPLPPGYYVVEVVPPDGYEIVEFGDRNVDFGESYVPTPVPAALPPACVGATYPMPQYLSFDGETPNPAYGDPAFPATPCSCSMKEVRVVVGQNTPCDFYLFTQVPKAARIVGMVLSDLSADTNPNSPLFGLNAAVPWIPMAVRDFAGLEIGRFYTDEYGWYNFLLPGSWTKNIPNPTGVSPHMFWLTLNDPGTPSAPDPFYNPNYTVFDSTWDAWDGKTTYLDTPNLPKTPLVATGVVDCFFQDGTPAIYRVDGDQPLGGPYVKALPGVITLNSVGPKDFTVPNPAADLECLELGTCDPTVNVTRDLGFGAVQGTVTLNDVPLAVTSWTDTTITAVVPAGAGPGQLMVTRGDTGLTSEIGITLHVKSRGYKPKPVWVAAGATIQSAIDAAKNGSLILVPPGTYYENVIVHKPVTLQGYGSGSTIINGSQYTLAADTAWIAKVKQLVSKKKINLAPGQDPNLITERGAGVAIFAKGKASDLDKKKAQNKLKAPKVNKIPMVDGFTVTGANRGSGIFVNAFARYAKISNNDVVDNFGNFGGGIRVGTPSLVNATNDGFYGSYNDHLDIHHNRVSGNSGIDGGGGLALFNGADDYWVHDNFICGNFSLLYGGGIAHFGLSDNGWIEHNKVLYNQAFDEAGGIMLAGELVPAAAPAGTLTPGAGTVNVNANLIFGNMAGDDGGGIRTLNYSGQDVTGNPTNAPQVLDRKGRPLSPPQWYAANITNNIISNNVSADAGGAISLDDTADCRIVSNTVANNTSTATSVDALIAGNNITSPQVGGIASREHSTGLQAAFDVSVAQSFSDPVLEDDIIWNNTSWHYDEEAGIPANRNLVFHGVWDLGVFPYTNTAVFPAVGSHTLSPKNCLITADTGGLYTGNGNIFDAPPVVAPDMGNPAFPAFVHENLTQVSATTVGLIGNLITTQVLAPLYWNDPTIGTDYHITGASSAIAAGTSPSVGLVQLQSDIDGDTRPVLGTPDIGADQYVGQ